MDLHILEHRLRVTSLSKAGLERYTHGLIKLVFLRDRTRCKFFSLTEMPDDYTLVLDEEGFKELPQTDYLQVAEATWLALNVVSNGHSSTSSQTIGVTKIAKSVIAPLAQHNVSVFMLSTYQTDFILVRESDLPAVIHTLSEEFSIYKEENGESVPVDSNNVTNGFIKPKTAACPTVHPVISPKNQFCVMSLDPDTLPTIATILMDVMFYSASLKARSADQDLDYIRFFSFSLIDGYISIVVDTQTQKRFPSNLLLTSASSELWRMVRIGGQPLGFDECGIVAQISEPLANADISAYYISTFNFDHALACNRRASSSPCARSRAKLSGGFVGKGEVAAESEGSSLPDLTLRTLEGSPPCAVTATTTYEHMNLQK